MDRALSRREERQEARAAIRTLHKNGASTYIVHYVCEDLNRDDGASPRVIAIALRNIGTKETSAFSIHLQAEVAGFGTDPPLNKDDFDALEKSILKQYFDFLKEHSDRNFVHWKMRDPVYGFPAIEHRFRVLGGRPVSLATSQLFDLSEIVRRIYGPGYTKNHPHLLELIRLNNITDKDLIPGKDEPGYFARGQYRALHNSALRKISVLSEIFERVWSDELKTDAKWQDMFGTSLLGSLAALRQHPSFSVFELIFALVGFVGSIIGILSFAF